MDTLKSSSSGSKFCTACHEIFKDLVYDFPVLQDPQFLDEAIARRRWRLSRKDIGIRGRTTNIQTIIEIGFYTLSQCKCSAAEGCLTCALFADGLLANLPDGRHLEEQLLVSYEWNESYSLDGSFRVRPKSYTAVTNAQDLPIYSFVLSSRTGQGPEGTMLESTGSEEAFNLMRDWKAQCRQMHEGCAPVDDVLPDRVIDVQDPIPKLVETQGQYLGQWAALSHCWGGQVPVQTTTNTRTSHMRGMPLQYLPATFRDAVLTCRKLDIRYLWIDSLCIVQDDLSEFEQQAPRMSRIFGEAAVVIAAATSVSSAIGLFRKQTVQVTHLNGPVYNGKDVSLTRPRSSMESLVLETRGWCLQESLLARATLIFRGPFLKWECPRGAYSDGSDNDVMPWTQLDYMRRTMNSTKPSPNVLWTTIVAQYTRRKLTFKSDRLPAVAGVVDRLLQNGIHTGRYLAGLFEDDILYHLCWYTTTIEEQPSKTIKGSAVPSWSWASNNDAISWTSNSTTDELEKCKTFQTCTVTCPTSSIDSLILTGRLFNTNICPDSNEEMQETIQVIMPPLRHQMDRSPGNVLDRKPLSIVWAFELLNYEVVRDYTLLKDGDVKGTILLLLENGTNGSDRDSADILFNRVGLALCYGWISDEVWERRTITLV